MSKPLSGHVQVLSKSWKKKHQISQLLLTRFLPNFKLRFLGTSRTDSNCHRDICPGNICPGDICTYQEYISCYWLDFEQSLKVGSWDNLYQIPTVMVTTFVQATYVPVTIVHISNISAVTFLDPILGGLNFDRPQFFLDQTSFLT